MGEEEKKVCKWLSFFLSVLITPGLYWWLILTKSPVKWKGNRWDDFWFNGKRGTISSSYSLSVGASQEVIRVTVVRPVVQGAEQVGQQYSTTEGTLTLTFDHIHTAHSTWHLSHQSAAHWKSHSLFTESSDNGLGSTFSQGPVMGRLRGKRQNQHQPILPHFQRITVRWFRWWVHTLPDIYRKKCQD